MPFLFRKNSRQLEAIFEWLSSVIGQDDLILVEREGKQEGYYFDFPLKFGSKPKRLSRVDDKDFTFFIKFFSRPPDISGDISGKEWQLIFQSSELEIYESQKRFNGKQFKPLRWGLNEAEKKTALKIARDALEKFLENREQLDNSYFTRLPPRLFFKTNLDVALWVRGRLRGSAVVENRHLGEGIAEAVILASRDFRFKPLSLEELTDTIIEITLMHELRLPLSADELKRGVIYPEKG